MRLAELGLLQPLATHALASPSLAAAMAIRDNVVHWDRTGAQACSHQDRECSSAGVALAGRSELPAGLHSARGRDDAPLNSLTAVVHVVELLMRWLSPGSWARGRRSQAPPQPLSRTGDFALGPPLRRGHSRTAILFVGHRWSGAARGA